MSSHLVVFRHVGVVVALRSVVCVGVVDCVNRLVQGAVRREASSVERFTNT